MESYLYRAPTMCFTIKGKEAGNLLVLSTQHVSKEGGVTQDCRRRTGLSEGPGARWSQELEPRADSPPCSAHNTQLFTTPNCSSFLAGGSLEREMRQF